MTVPNPGNTAADETLGYDGTAPVGPSLPSGYEPLGELGRGGMGVVYRVRHLGLGRIVALKMIRAGLHADDAQRERFRSEARAVAALAHPAIVAIYETGEHEGLPFFTLELCEGGSLAQKVRDNPLSAIEAATLMRTVAEGMAHAHASGLVHRDLTPGNVLLTASGQPKVADFGLAKLLGDEAERTQSGTIDGNAHVRHRGRTRPAAPVVAASARRSGDDYPEVSAKGAATALRQREGSRRRPGPVPGRRADPGSSRGYARTRGQVGAA